jgi:tetratricopeptide (TPR) repeat protein
VFVDAHLLRGLVRLTNGQFKEALEDFNRASEYPENLSVARPSNDRRAPQVAYFTGLAHQALGANDEAAKYFRRAADQSGTGRWLDTQIYQSLALKQLGEVDQARQALEAITATVEVRLARTEEDLDFFAKFGTRLSESALRARDLSVLGFAQSALGLSEAAAVSLGSAVDLDTSQLWARHYLGTLP